MGNFQNIPLLLPASISRSSWFDLFRSFSLKERIVHYHRVHTSGAPTKSDPRLSVYKWISAVHRSDTGRARAMGGRCTRAARLFSSSGYSVWIFDGKRTEAKTPVKHHRRLSGIFYANCVWMALGEIRGLRFFQQSVGWNNLSKQKHASLFPLLPWAVL